MATELPRALLEVNYYAAAQEYLRKLPLEHFMEARPQETQREITLESFAVVRSERRDVHVFNEMLVQYPLPRRKRPGQVVPDNMVALHDQPIKAVGSYDVPLQPVGPLWVLEYVSKNNKRKDYDDNMRKYEHELKVPYYLLFVPDEQELTLYHHSGEKYATVVPNGNGRHPVPEVEMEVALHEGWLRFWFRGELLPLPAELVRGLKEERQARMAAEQRADALAAEVERLRRQLGEK
jgi:Uma2 family endonuclease